MKALLLTNEYPPHVYGGAGVHVEYLARELAQLIEVEVRCFGDQHSAGERLAVRGYPPVEGIVDEAPASLRSPLGSLARNIGFSASDPRADVVHCHTWYTHFAGVLHQLLYGTPLVITTHSLEPLRPWKREQLGRGYDLSSWIEQTALERADAVIAVSEETRRDILRLFELPAQRVTVIPNGIDVDEYRPTDAHDALDAHGIPVDRPYVLFVGRITRQKGIIHLLRAAERLDAAIGLVLCAGAPDTEELGAETARRVEQLRRTRQNVTWIREMLPRTATIQLYSHAALFCCPSIYEPFGIINLEAMACCTPVVASAVGGINDVVIDGTTGVLVPFDQRSETDFEPGDSEQFADDLAAAIDRLMADEPLRARMARAGRERVVERYAWSAIALQVRELYEQLAERRRLVASAPR